MTSLAWLVPVALLLGLFGLVAFLWALRSGQFDDLDGAAFRILEDDREDPAPLAKKKSGPEQKPPHGSDNDQSQAG